MKTNYLACATFFFATLVLCIAGYLFFENDDPQQLPTQNVLTGFLKHDFGVVEISAGFPNHSHVFELTNTSNRAIHVQSISSSCGCLAAVVDRDDVNPGERILIEASMSITHSGQQQATIYLETNHPESPLIQLSLQAQGRRLQTLSTQTQRLKIKPGSTASITLYLMDYDTQTVQPTPSFDHKSNLSCEFTGWKLMTPGSLESGIPSRWKGDIQISATAPTADDNQSTLSVLLPNGEMVTILVNISP